MRKAALPLLAALLAAGCGAPVPPEKSAYVGEWQGPQMTLLITQDGRIEYQRIRGSKTTSVKSPLKRFVGDNFVAGVGPMETTFEVSSAPHELNGAWTMTVDGVELRKVR